MSEGDPRLGMFDSPDTSGVNQILDRHALKSIGALPADDLNRQTLSTSKYCKLHLLLQLKPAAQVVL